MLLMLLGNLSKSTGHSKRNKGHLKSMFLYIVLHNSDEKIGIEGNNA